MKLSQVRVSAHFANLHFGKFLLQLADLIVERNHFVVPVPGRDAPKFYHAALQKVKAFLKLLHVFGKSQKFSGALLLPGHVLGQTVVHDSGREFSFHIANVAGCFGSWNSPFVLAGGDA
jgi:hypothetical protein